MGSPATKEVTRLLVAATDRTYWPMLGRPRLPKRAIGHWRSAATLASLEPGLSALGCPTRSSNSRSSVLSE